MHRSVVAIAVSAILVPAVVASERTPVWHSDYHRARLEGREQQKPLFVVIGAGKAGYHDVSRDGRLNEEVRRLLADHYVCLYVDTEHIGQRHLAEDFNIPEGPGVVISDASGKVQAFRHEGRLSNDSLADYLRRYADPDRPVETTETHAPQRLSYYEAPPVPAAPVMAPVFAPAFGGFMGGSGGCST